MELTTRGWSQHQIAADLGITQAAVSKLLARVERRLLQELADTVERQKVRQSARLEYLFGEAMRAWTDSKADRTRRRQRKTQAGSGGAEATVAEIVTDTHHGDPRFLDEARKALADHRKIWGLDAPQKVDLRASRNPYDGMTEDDLRAEFTRQARLLNPSTETTDAITPADPSTTTLPEPTDVHH